MKQTLTVFLILIGFNSYSQDNFFDSTCNCIEKITENSNKDILKKQIQNCFQKSFKTHNPDIEKILNDYISENPEMNMKTAKKNLSNILTEKLTEKCPQFKKIDEKLTGQTRSSKNILKLISSEICSELKDKSTLTDEIVDPIMIMVIEKHKVNIYGQYNLDNRTEMKRFTTDLNFELMKDCNKYKKYVYKKNSEK